MSVLAKISTSEGRQKLASYIVWKKTENGEIDIVSRSMIELKLEHLLESIQNELDTYLGEVIKTRLNFYKEPPVAQKEI